MKKLLLVFLAALFSTIGFAQPFILAVDGFRGTEDETKDYIVVSIPDCDKAALFQKAKNYFTVTYNSPQNVMSESGADAISILGGDNVQFNFGGIAGRRTARFSYKLVCEFRDERVKITPVWVDLIVQGNSISLQSPSGMGIGIYRKSGELRDDRAKSQIEAIINPLIAGLEKALKETTAPASEDW